MLLSEHVFGAVLAFGAGIFFSSFFSSSPLLILALLVLGLLLLSVFWQRRKVASAGMLVLVAALGMGHYAYSAGLGHVLAEPQQVSFQGRVVAPLEQDEQGTRITVQADGLAGRILVFAPLFEEVREGDTLSLVGKIQSPSAFEDFDYPLYLAKEGVYWIMFSPRIEVSEQGKEPFLSGFRKTLQEKLDALFSPPESSLLSAMLLGNKAGLPEELKEDLNATGTRHITAVSGMHVAILSGMAFAFLLSLGLAKKKSSLLVLAFLAFFVALTGFQASAVRAGIMGSSLLAAGLLGRRNAALRALVFAGGGMLLFNPLLLAHDIGFQLSFLAVLGILLFFPLFQHVFRNFPNPFGLRDVAGMSVAAQAFTLPLVFHHFGILSFVLLVANLLLVPLLPLVLLGGVLLLAAALLFPLAVAPLAFLEGLLLSYFSFVIGTLSELPFATSEVAGFSLWSVLPFLVAASLFAWHFQRSRKFQFREETMLLWK